MKELAEFDSKKMLDAVNTLRKVVAKTDLVNLRTSKDGYIEVGLVSNLHMGQIKIEAVVTKEAKFAAPIDVFCGIVKNRGQLKVAKDGNKLVLTAVKGKYTADLIGADWVESNPLATLEKGANNIPIDKEGVLALADTWSNVAIESIISNNAISLVAGVRKGYLYVGCATKYHCALVSRAKVKSDDFDIEIPLPLFQTVIGVFGDQPFKISIGKSNTFYWSDSIAVTIPQIETDPVISLDAIKKQMASVIPEKCSLTLEVKSKDFNRAFESCHAMYDAGSHIDVDYKDDKLTLTLGSNWGSVKETIKVKTIKSRTGKLKMKLETVMLADLLRLAPEGLMTLMFTDRLAVFSVANKDGAYSYATMAKE